MLQVTHSSIVVSPDITYGLAMAASGVSADTLGSYQARITGVLTRSPNPDFAALLTSISRIVLVGYHETIYFKLDGFYLDDLAAEAGEAIAVDEIVQHPDSYLNTNVNIKGFLITWNESACYFSSSVAAASDPQQRILADSTFNSRMWNRLFGGFCGRLPFYVDARGTGIIRINQDAVHFSPLLLADITDVAFQWGLFGIEYVKHYKL